MSQPKDFVDVYNGMLEVKNGRADGAKVGWMAVSKKSMRAIGVKWDVVEAAAKILGLDLEPHGRYGYVVTKPNN